MDLQTVAHLKNSIDRLIVRGIESRQVVGYHAAGRPRPDKSLESEVNRSSVVDGNEAG